MLTEKRAVKFSRAFEASNCKTKFPITKIKLYPGYSSSRFNFMHEMTRLKI